MNQACSSLAPRTQPQGPPTPSLTVALIARRRGTSLYVYEETEA